jgi:uncharacterized protein (TIGR03435 family)
MNFAKIFRSACATTAVFAAAIVAGILIGPLIRAQSSSGQQATGTPRPSFEVASIKPDISGSRNVMFSGDAGRYTASNVTVKGLIKLSYNVNDFQISGGPAWISSERFDIDAKVPDSLAAQLQKLPRARQSGEKMLMVQSLLSDRFKLAVTHETKELPIYALMVGKGGAKLTEASPPDTGGNLAPTSPPASGGPMTPLPGGFFLTTDGTGRFSFTMKAAPLDNLVGVLTGQLGRMILDQTALKGTYDATLQWTSETGLQGESPSGADAPDVAGTSIFTAIQDQLGLKLESTKGPVDTFVIDHIEEPSPN